MTDLDRSEEPRKKELKKLVEDLPKEALPEAIEVMREIREFYETKTGGRQFISKPTRTGVGKVVSIREREPLTLDSDN